MFRAHVGPLTLDLYRPTAVELGRRRRAQLELGTSVQHPAAGCRAAYQFYRNAWAHPHVAAGVDLTWETHEQEDQPVFFYDSQSRVSPVLQPARTIGPSTELLVRPFVELGTKLYVSPRSFFRTDLRVTLGGGAEEVLLRFGFGVDF